MKTQASTQLDFATVYSEHAAYVRGLLVRHGVRAADVDDVLQEVFVTVHRRLPSFEGRARIETWLHAVTWRVVANYRRRQPAITVGEDVDASASVDDDAAPALPNSSVRAFLNELDVHLSDLLALHAIGGLSVSELAEITGSARATIRARLERGRAALGRRVWTALTRIDGDAALERFAPRVEQQRVALPLARPIVHGRNAFSSVGNVAIAVWRGKCTTAAIEALIPVMFATADASPDGFCFLSVIDPSAVPPDRDARQLNAWVAAKLGPRIKAAAWVTEGSLLTTLVAPIINTSVFLAGVPINARFFDGLGPATSWLAQYASTDAEQIAAHVELMRQHVSEGFDEGSPR